MNIKIEQKIEALKDILLMESYNDDEKLQIINELQTMVKTVALKK